MEKYIFYDDFELGQQNTTPPSIENVINYISNLLIGLYKPIKKIHRCTIFLYVIMHVLFVKHYF